MKEIPLRDRNGIVAFAKVDDLDFDALNAFRWHITGDENRKYAQRSYRKNGKRFNSRMHREILGLKNPYQYGDHKDGDGLNNQRSNIRKCSNAQNQMNCSARKKGYKGVHAHGKKWRAYIKKNQKSMNLGTFNTEIEAAKAYNEAATQLFGEFARLNTLTEK